VLSTHHARLRLQRAPGIPHALFGRKDFLQQLERSRCENAEAYLAVIARSESDEAIHLAAKKEWIASLRSQ
jgi:hypothetical protein